MPIIAVLSTAGNADEVSEQLVSVGSVEWTEAASSVVTRVARGGVGAVLTGLDDERGQSIAPLVVTLAARWPQLPVVIYGRVNGATLRKWLAVVAAGLRTECAVRPNEPLAPVMRRALSPHFRPGVTAVLLQRFVPRAPAPLRVFLAIGAICAPARPGVERIALWSGVTARTIERRLQRAGWPSAHTVLQSFAALDAVWLMTEYGWSARRVQEVRGFAHGSSVSRLVSRYAGVRPIALREEGGFAEALEYVTRVFTPAPRS